MTPPNGALAWSGVARWLQAAALVCAAAYLLLFLYLAFQRLDYPFELEWMEGGSLQHVWRVLAGEPLYVTPSLEFVPHPYPPFYYYVSALFALVFGPGFASLRLVSALSAVGSMALVYAFVWRETERRALAFVCAGLFAATYRASGAYFDIGRLDSLFAFLALLSLYLLVSGTSRARLASAAVVAFLCVMTKQTGALLLAPAILWCLWSDWSEFGRNLRKWRRFPWFGLVTVVLVVVGGLLLNGVLDEHFLLHVVLAQSAHGIEVFRVGLFFGSDLLQTLPVPCLLTIAYLVLARRTRTDSDAFYVAFLLGTLVACLIPRIKVSGAINNLIPAYACLCIFTGLAVSRLQALRLATESRRSALAALLFSSLVVQLIALGYDPASALPRRADEAAGQKLLQIISGFEGEVLIPVGGYLAGLAGKQVYAHQMPVSDFAKSGLAEADPLGESYLEAIRAQRFAAIIDSNTGFLASYPDDTVLRTHYRLVGPIFRDPVTFTPRSGARIRPGSLWVPRLAD